MPCIQILYDAKIEAKAKKNMLGKERMGVTIPAYYCKHIWIGNANVPNSYGADSLMGEFVWLDQIINSINNQHHGTTTLLDS